MNATTLPVLREELVLHPCAASDHGAPCWSLFDPARNQFFHIDWCTFEMLSRWSLASAEQVAASVTDETTLSVTESDVQELANYLLNNELVVLDTPESSVAFAGNINKRKQRWSTWLLHHYLFFRIPLWHPDAWLKATLAWVEPFFSRYFLWLTCFILVTGLIELSRQWDSFVSSLVDTFTFNGLVHYLMALVFIKLMHELGHAWACRRYGGPVPSMGVALLVMFPVAYTDVNSVWSLPLKRQRLVVGGAGIVVELVIAAWCTLAWCLLPNGALRDLVFLLATTTWVSSLLINCSPFLRFDGYFLLMDWLNLPNLHQRAFALARWHLRAVLFGIKDDEPEIFGDAFKRGLIVFAWATWAFRLIMFAGIAVLVYFAVPKPLGPFLALVEIAWFIVLPIWAEMLIWKTMLKKAFKQRRIWYTLLVSGLALALLVLPWDKRVFSEGILQPSKRYHIVSEGPALLETIAVKDQSQVLAEQRLLALTQPDLAYQHQSLDSQLATADWQYSSVGVDYGLRTQTQVLASSLKGIEAQIKSVEYEQSRHIHNAPFNGLFYLSNPDLKKGEWVASGETLGVIVDNNEWVIEAYLDDTTVDRIQPGDQGRFYTEAGTAVLNVVVEAIDHDVSRELHEPMLSVFHGGQIVTYEHEGLLVPEHALYKMRLKVSGDYQPQAIKMMRGKLVLQGQSRAYADAFATHMAAVFMRESGF